MYTDQYESLIKAQREANELFERLEAAPPTIDEITLQERYPETPRTRILRMVVHQRLSA
jgi:hypothetical protein